MIDRNKLINEYVCTVLEDASEQELLDYAASALHDTINRLTDEEIEQLVAEWGAHEFDVHEQACAALLRVSKAVADESRARCDAAVEHQASRGVSAEHSAFWRKLNV